MTTHNVEVHDIGKILYHELGQEKGKGISVFVIYRTNKTHAKSVSKMKGSRSTNW